ncbi:MAG: putative lipid II flippase FtsW [Elusimicrobiota bacterium]|nr:putative lipid II flippase FtsW [Elusimicrobiota bacterium]
MGKRLRNKNSKGEIDYVLLAVAAALIIFGTVMVFSSSAIIAGEKYNNMYFFILRRFMWIAIGSIGMGLALKIDYKKWVSLSRAGLPAVIVLLVMVLIPRVGHSVGGARRWLRMGPVGFQPAEFAKIAVVLYLASLLDRKFSKVKDSFKELIPPLVIVAIIIILIYRQPDFGSAAIIALLTGIMLFLGGVKFKNFFIGAGIVMPFIIYGMLAYEYRRIRLFTFLKPFENMRGTGYQLAHSLIALGDGGIKGVGLGAGCQKLFFIPEVHTDFVFAIIGQELGFIGTMVTLILFAIFTYRGLKIAINHKELVGKLAAAGLVFLISIQAVFNMGVVTGCLPTKGLPLPYISFGGTSLIFNMFALGIILNISRTAQ